MGHSHLRTALRCTALAIVVAIAIPAAASAAAPDRYPVDGPAVAKAQEIARAHWGTDPCSAKIAQSWTTELDGTTAAEASWENPTSTYDNPAENTNCVVRFNAGVDFDWSQLCTVVAHEYGHLTGHRHSDDPGDVMTAIYNDPLPECVATPDPTAPTTDDEEADPAAQTPGATLRARRSIQISAFFGKRHLPVACELPDADRCTVRLAIAGQTIGRGTGLVDADGGSRVSVRPVAGGRRFLQRTHRRAVRATLSTTDAGGEWVRRTITLRR